MVRVAVAILVAACGTPTGRDELVPDAPDAPIIPPTFEVVLDGLEPGWLVTTSRLTGASAPAETTLVSDGSPLTLGGAPEDLFVATVTDAAGNLISTKAMKSPCTMAASRQLDVPSEYASIQDAVNAASPGDTVKVAPGTYTESVALRAGVCLLGSGAKRTTLDAGGEARSLVDLTNAPGSVVSGFTFRGVGQGTGCAQPSDPFACSADWYTAGLYFGGRQWNDPVQDAPPIVANNLFVDNDIGVLLYWRSAAIVRNNVFVANRLGLVANHFQSRTLVANNVFYANTELAIGNQAAYLDLINNVIAESAVAVRFEYIQTGFIRCNVFFSNDVLTQETFTDPPTRFTIGTDGNVEADPKFVDPGQGDFHIPPNSPGKDSGCFPGDAFEADGTQQDIGVYGGPLASWIDL
jgi:hypothetical protein